MSGVTKHIFDQEVRDILSMWDCEIKTIQPLLPKEYSKSDIIALLKEFYPYEWRSVEVKYTYYQTKDRYIKRTYGKNRYDMKAPEVLLMNDLLREIDEKYCRHSNGTSFDYDKRNYSTSHVHMMLSIALSRMIDKCESVFFLNSENCFLDYEYHQD